MSLLLIGALAASTMYQKWLNQKEIYRIEKIKTKEITESDEESDCSSENANDDSIDNDNTMDNWERYYCESLNKYYYYNPNLSIATWYDPKKNNDNESDLEEDDDDDNEAAGNVSPTKRKSPRKSVSFRQDSIKVDTYFIEEEMKKNRTRIFSCQRIFFFIMGFCAFSCLNYFIYNFLNPSNDVIPLSVLLEKNEVLNEIRKKLNVILKLEQENKANISSIREREQKMHLFNRTEEVLVSNSSSTTVNLTQSSLEKNFLVKSTTKKNEKIICKERARDRFFMLLQNRNLPTKCEATPSKFKNDSIDLEQSNNNTIYNETKSYDKKEENEIDLNKLLKTDWNFERKSIWGIIPSMNTTKTNKKLDVKDKQEMTFGLLLKIFNLYQATNQSISLVFHKDYTTANNDISFSPAELALEKIQEMYSVYYNDLGQVVLEYKNSTFDDKSDADKADEVSRGKQKKKKNFFQCVISLFKKLDKKKKRG